MFSMTEHCVIRFNRQFLAEIRIKHFFEITTVHLLHTSIAIAPLSPIPESSPSILLNFVTGISRVINQVRPQGFSSAM